MVKKDELALWMRERKIFSSHEVCKWGNDNYHIRADRDKRDFQRAGYIRKLTEFEKTLAGYKCKDAVYKVIEKKPQESLF